MALTRRQFLQNMGWAIATLGMSQASFLAWGDRQQQALAQAGGGRLALLVGINQYAESISDLPPMRGLALTGCLTDVTLQQELLVHRFGFRPADILVLTDAAATRQAIIDAFQTHLIAQARPSDKVLFHFSGLGSRVRSPSSGDDPKTDDLKTDLKTLVPVDGELPTEENPALQDLSLSTLNALLSALTTPNVTTVLDAAFSNRGEPLQGNFRVRSRPSVPQGMLTEAAKLMTMTTPPLPPESMRGLYLAATHDRQPGLEGQWSGFSAGLLTYALTQYLWEMTPPQKIQVVFPAITQRVQQWAGGLQAPALYAKRGAESLYSLTPVNTGAVGVVQSVQEDGGLQVWLGGLPPQVLECYGAKAILTTTDATQSVALVGRSRQGLVLKAMPSEPDGVDLARLVGQPVQESLRLIPRSLVLTIALDPGLERIERVDATSAFSTAKVNVVAAGEQAADLLFGKATVTTLTAALPPTEALPAPTLAQSSYGLFYPPKIAVPGTLNLSDEAVKTAVTRLTAKLPRLLAIKYLQLTENSATSDLAVRAVIETTDAAATAITEATTRQGQGKRAIALPPDGTLPTAAAALPLQCRIQNLGTEPLYLLWVTLPQANRALRFAMLADEVTDAPSQAIAPNASIRFPQASLSSGQVELFLIASQTPFLKTAALIESQKASVDTLDPLQISLDRVEAILDDLSQPDAPPDSYALNVKTWATLRLRYQLV